MYLVFKNVKINLRALLLIITALGVLASTSQGVLSDEVAAYQQRSGIGDQQAEQIDAMLTELSTAAGTKPVFLWLGGLDYNQQDQLECVIGGPMTAVGDFSESPVAGPNYMLTTSTSKFLRGPNPTAGESSWSWSIWYQKKVLTQLTTC